MKKQSNLTTSLFHTSTSPTKASRAVLAGLAGILPGVITNNVADKTDNSATHKRSSGYGLFLTNKVFRI